jgi:acetyl-CoA carboxylase biotin carboxyl carrier protein
MAATPKPSMAKKNALKTTASAETRLVQDLANILDSAGLAELEYESETVAIRLSRVAGMAPVNAVQPAAAVPVAAPVAAASVAVEPAVSIQNPADHAGAVTSPMVGTVYSAAEPGSPNFISEGDTVKVGQTLFIIEAMKVMNPITAPAAGSVVRILVENAQPVEFGQALVIIE